MKEYNVTNTTLGPKVTFYLEYEINSLQILLKTLGLGSLSSRVSVYLAEMLT